MAKDEYNDIYQMGFVMEYNNGHLNNAKEVKDCPDAVGSDDNIFIHCKKCNCFMNWKGDDRVWQCPSCGKRVREMTALSKLDQQNNAFLNSFDNDYEDLY